MKKLLILISVFGAVGIALGAFGAHTLKESLTDAQLASFETGVRYLMYHVIASLGIAALPSLDRKARQTTISLFSIGIVLFSGSIFLLTAGTPAKFIWILTPLGGLIFITGWLRLAWSIAKTKF